MGLVFVVNSLALTALAGEAGRPDGGGDQPQQILSDVDETFKLIPNDGTAWFNRGRGSWWGGIETDGTIERWASEVNGGFSKSFQKLGDVSYKMTVNAGTPSAGFTIEQRTIDDGASSVLWKSWRNEDLPILRCKAVVEWKNKRLRAHGLVRRTPRRSHTMLGRGFRSPSSCRSWRGRAALPSELMGRFPNQDQQARPRVALDIP